MLARNDTEEERQFLMRTSRGYKKMKEERGGFFCFKGL
jgi:hypothetical protein